MCVGGSGGDGGAAERRRQEEERQARIREGNKSINDTFSQFDDDFYKVVKLRTWILQTHR